MSLIFSDTSTKKGVIQTIERRLGFQDGDISGVPATLSYFTAEVNLAMDEIVSKILPFTGTWQYDDFNQTDLPIIYTNLVVNQRDYSFTVDGSSNVILDIYRVFIKTSSTGYYTEIFPVDQQSEQGTQGFTNGLNITGIPYLYDKSGNTISLDPIPSTSITSGLKVYINREPTYFTTSDTTKKPGFAGLFHECIALKVAQEYADTNGLSNFKNLYEKYTIKIAELQNYYGSRERDTDDVLAGEQTIFL